MLIALTAEPKDFLAQSLFEAVDGPGTNEDVLIEILCSRKSNEEIDSIKKAFQSSTHYNFKTLPIIFYFCCCFVLEYDQSLEQKIFDDTSGDFMNLLLDILHTARKPETTPVDQRSTKRLINIIATSKEENYLFQSSIVTVFSRESFKQLYHVITNFAQETGQTIHQSIEDGDKDSDYTKALLAIGNVE